MLISFLAMLPNCTDLAITVQQCKSHIQIQSTLCTLVRKGKKGIQNPFLVQYSKVKFCVISHALLIKSLLGLLHQCTKFRLKSFCYIKVLLPRDHLKGKAPCNTCMGKNISMIICFPSSPEYLKRDQILQPGSLQTDSTPVTLFLPFCPFSELQRLI